MRISKLLIWIMWIIVILAVVIVLWYILRNSPSFEQAILVLLLGLSITTLVKLRVLDSS